MEKKKNESEIVHTSLPVYRVAGRLYFLASDGYVHSVLMARGRYGGAINKKQKKE